MPRFLRDLTLFFLLQAAIAGALFWHAANNPGTYLAVTQDKHERLAQIAGPRMILVGGSSVAFGMDSAELARRFPDYQPINMGLHFGIGLEAMLAEIQPIVRSGDLLVLAPEYHAYGSGADAAVLTETACYRGSGFEQLLPANWSETRLLLDYNALSILRTVSHLGFHGIRERIRPAKHNGIYSRGSFNEYGDMVAHVNKDSTGTHRDPLFMPNYTNNRLPATIAMLNAFADKCRSQGATVYYVYPPVPETQLAKGEAHIREIAQALDRNLKFPILNRPDDSAAPLDHFFDAPYHLSGTGRQRHTSHLAEALENQITRSAVSVARVPGAESGKKLR